MKLKKDFRFVICILLPATLSLFSTGLFAQTPGEWTWMNGFDTANSVGVYGTKGIPSPNNTPPGLYEACEWTDLQGNFWLFGGGFGEQYSDLWKYSPLTNEWTWVKGPGIPNQTGVYGTQGIPSVNNNPGARGYGIASWIDVNGDLWLFGGYVHNLTQQNICLGDLWKYHISTNEWTWMGGQSASPNTGNYGIQGISSATNLPPGKAETSGLWTDNNNLWLFAGGNSNYYNDLWKYSISTNEWTWMKGSNTGNQLGVYGIKGIANPANTPGARTPYSQWKDNNGNLWLFAGNSMGSFFNDVWKYTISSNNWTWMYGSNIPDDPGSIGTKCVPSVSALPSGRFENRARWIDGCGNFWTFGGFVTGGGTTKNDLWHLNISNGEWTFVNGSLSNYPSGNYGIKTISSPTNMPGGKGGAVSWKDNNGNLWLFGGLVAGGEANDLWRYVPDPSCVPCNSSTLSATASNILCNGANTGTATATVSGGTSPFTYLWSPGGQTTPTITGLAAGIYTVTVTDSAGLTASHTVTITQPTSITGFVNTTPTICGSSTGTATVTANGGTGSFTYLWSSGETTATINNLAVGSYSVTITDSLGCPQTASGTVASSSLTVNLGNDTTLCPGDVMTLNPTTSIVTYLWQDNSTNPTFTITQQGIYWVAITNTCGTATDTIHISTLSSPVISLGNDTSLCTGTSIVLNAGAGFTNYLWQNNSTNQTFTASTAGTYYVSVTNTCGTATDTIHISTLSSPVISLGNDTSLCAGTSIVLNAGAGYTNYLWQNSSTNQTYTASAAGTYYVSVTNTCGTTTDSIHIATLATPTVTVSNPSICPGQPANLIANGATTYSWSAGAMAIGTNTANVSPLITTTYTLTGTTAGCSNTATSTVTVYSAPSISAGADVTISSGASTPLNATGGGTYSWSPATGLSCTNCANPVSSPSSTIDYCVTVTDANGCVDSACVRVSVESPCPSNEDFTVPTAFSPNNDGHNDLFILHGFENCITSFSIIIFDRWGEKVFETTDASKGWDGNYHGKPMNAAVFVYSIKATLISGEKITKKGNVSLIR